MIKKKQSAGFSLVATITVMVILSLVAVGLLTLTGVTLRSGAHEKAQMKAKANAKMALTMALGNLQSAAGPDRRITADADLFIEGTDESDVNKVVGVWSSWGEKDAEDGIPSDTGPGSNVSSNPIAIDNPENFSSRDIDYSKGKRERFIQWLISNPDEEDVKEVGFGAGISQSATTRTLFNERQDGFNLYAPSVEIQDEEGKTSGAYAWAVVQENTKAKILPESYTRLNSSEEIYDGLAAPQTSGIELNPAFNEDIENDATIARKLVSTSTLEIAESDVLDSAEVATVNPDFTIHSKGVLSDVLRGRLKRDLTSAFELSNRDFEEISKSNDGVEALGDFPTSGFSNEQPLFNPSSNFEGTISLTDNYGKLKAPHIYNLGHLPTFQSLRSHYRIYRHLFGGDSNVTARDRMRESVAWPSGQSSESAVLPILDRLVIFLGLKKQAGSDKLAVVINPFVVLWNPYNVNLQTEGYTVFPRIDFPIRLNMRYINRTGTVRSSWVDENIEMYLSEFLSPEYPDDSNEGRSKYPYFFLQLQPPNNSNYISMEPGELRVFSMKESSPQAFLETWPADQRSYAMEAVEDAAGLNYEGGIEIKIDRAPSNLQDVHGTNPRRYCPHDLSGNTRIIMSSSYFFNDPSTADPSRLHVHMQEKTPSGSLENWESRDYGDVSIVQMTGGTIEEEGRHSSIITTDTITYGADALNSNTVRPFALLVLNHRTAQGSADTHDDGTSLVSSDIAITNNCRQPYATGLLKDRFTSFDAAPHYGITYIGTATTNLTNFIDMPGRNAYWGSSNGTTNGRTHVVFSELPRYPMLSLGSFQHMDMSNNIFSPYYQFANSFWSPYYKTRTVYERDNPSPEASDPSSDPEVYDYGYLANEALWDGYFFSGAAPEYNISGGGGGNPYGSDQISISKEASTVVRDFVDDPTENSLRNGRHHLHIGNRTEGEIAGRLTGRDAYNYMAAHLMVDGSFNINSTSVAAWTAFLASARDEGRQRGETPLSRNHHPSGIVNDHWRGFRSLTDGQIRRLAEELVEGIKERNKEGPFLSLAEFVNRRIGGSYDQSGVLQQAITDAGLNTGVNYGDIPNVDAFLYGDEMRSSQVGVGIPGYLNQGDVLTSIGSFVSARSDTFIVRARGESKNAQGKVIAKATCEALVQRLPDYVDDSQDAANAYEDVNETNKQYGRKFKVISFRWLTPKEVS